MKIEIDTHNSTREEVKELVEYLEENCWDFRPHNLVYETEEE